jgi:Dolichyl-phosphate-mannose-protein mannosyltransferase
MRFKSARAWRGEMPFLAIVVSAAAVVLSGWKSRIPNLDVLTSIDSARQLIAGRLPAAGVLTSFASFTPPGAAWLMAPGMLLFRDPRLFEYVGSVGLYICTLVGIVLLARRSLGAGCALLAAFLYAFSDLGLAAASTVWQRYPIHAFFVWMVYWTARWIDDDRPAFLAAALVTWSCGMYVFMEMAPAILIVPAIWFVRRPTVRWAPLVAAATVTVVVWYPYLRFEAGRGFSDVRSQLQRTAMLPASFNSQWCDPSAAPEAWLQYAAAGSVGAPSSEPLLARTRQWVSRRMELIATEFLFANFTGASAVPGGAALLLALTLVGTMSLLVGSRALERAPASDGRRRGRVRRFGILIAVAGVVLNEVTLTRLLSHDGVLSPSSVHAIRVFQAAALAGASALTLFSGAIEKSIERARAEWADTRRAGSSDAALLALSVVIPWLALAMVAESVRRFWWAWPLQAIALAAAVTYVPARFRAPRWVSVAASLTVAAVVAGNAVLGSRLHDWARNGWTGHDAIEIEITDRVAALVHGSGFDSAAVGYDTNIWPFMAMYHAVDPRYKAGADFDMLLEYRHGIANADRCAEGFSSRDTYRVLQTTDLPTVDPADVGRLISRDRADFDVKQQVGGFQILQRRAPTPEN